MTEFYDSYIDSYANPTSPTPPVPIMAPAPAPAPTAPSTIAPTERVAAWARENATAPPARAPSSFGGSMRSGTIKRRPTRRMVVASTYDEDEEGYVTGSGEWDEFELVKIRVKIHFDDDVRGMALDPQVSFQEFCQRIADKFEIPVRSMRLRFKDEDGGKVTLQDESDYELAIETARESAKGRPEGKLEVWCDQK